MVPLELSDRPHPARDARAVRDLGGLVGGADVVHAHGLRAAAVAVLAVGRGAVPVVATLHNAAPTGALTGAVYAALERVVALRSTLVLGVSADLVDADAPARRPAHRPGRRGSAPAPRPRRRDRYAVHADLGLDPLTSLAVVVARLAPQKGLDLLLDAQGELRGDDLDLITVVAGDGPLRAPLQARIDAEQLPVRLLGHRDDVPDLLAAADVVVSSAVWEGQPVGIQEALHAGRRSWPPTSAAPLPWSATPPCSCHPQTRSRCRGRSARSSRSAASATTCARRRSSAPPTCRPRRTRSRRPSRPTARCCRRRPRPEHRSEGWEPASRTPCRVGVGAAMTYR